MKKSRIWFPFYLLTIAAVLALSQIGSRAVTVIAESTPLPRGSCIIIDAGHGGVDGGATSCTGVLESAYNLSIATRLNDLCHLLGYHTAMIRTSDISIYTKGETIAQMKISDLKERVRIVNETEGALLLSIHQNTFSDSRYHGVQVFYAGTEGSKTLAQELQAAFSSSLGADSSRASKRLTGIYLLDHVQAPAVLIECGFLSNPAEEALLRSADYQKKLCGIILTASARYLSNS